MRSISLHLLGGTQYGKGQKGAGYPYIIYSWILHTTHLQIELHMPCMWPNSELYPISSKDKLDKNRCVETLLAIHLQVFDGHLAANDWGYHLYKVTGGSWRSGHHTVCTPVRSISQKKCSQSLVGEWHFALVTCATLINSDPRPLYHPHESLMRTIFTAWPWPQQTLLIFSFKRGIRVRERGETHTHTHTKIGILRTVSALHDWLPVSPWTCQSERPMGMWAQSTVE